MSSEKASPPTTHASVTNRDYSAGTGQSSPINVADDDERLLQSLGYKGEFKREFTTGSACCFCFSIMGVVASFSSTLNFPLTGAGHVGIVWAWAAGSVFVWPVALSLAELASAYPTSGGVYYFSGHLATPRWAPFAAWATGWFNTVGQVALVASILYTAAQMLTALVTVSTGAVYSLGATYGIFCALMVGLFLLSSCATSVLAKLNYLYVVLNLGTALAVIVALAATGPHVDAATAFGSFENLSGWQNNGMAFLLSLTAVMWTHTGYDSAAHVAEETRNSSRVAPLAICSAVLGTSIVGFLLSIVTSFSITNISATMQAPPGELAMAQVLLDHLGSRGMLALFSFIFVVQFNTAAAQCVDASRAIFAFSRDGALPGSQLWSRVHPRLRTPVWAVAFVCGGATLLGLLTLQLEAGLALFSTAVIALYLSYATPIFCRLFSSRFEPSPNFSLGRLSRPCAAVATSYVGFIVVILLFPNANPVEAATMNWSVVILGTIWLGAGLWWIVSAHKWFKGPACTFVAADLSLDSPTMTDEKDKSAFA